MAPALLLIKAVFLQPLPTTFIFHFLIMIARKLIAIVDDDADDRYLVEDTFLRAGYSGAFRQFENGPQFLEYLHKTPTPDLPGILFLDLNMPVIDGKQVLKEVKRSDRVSQIPVIVFTTAISDLEKRLCFQMGASAYITKPSSLSDMMEMVKGISLVFGIPLQNATNDFSIGSSLYLSNL